MKNIKRVTALTLGILMIFFAFTACGGGDSSGTSDTVYTVSSLAQKVVTETANPSDFSALDSFTVDYDLTAMSMTATVATAQQIMNDPASYEGKKIRITGYYNQSYYEGTGKYYDYIIGYDATACCAAWNFEFICNDKPDGLKAGSMISLVGTFGYYDEEGKQYFYIDVDKLCV